MLIPWVWNLYNNDKGLLCLIRNLAVFDTRNDVSQLKSFVNIYKKMHF